MPILGCQNYYCFLPRVRLRSRPILPDLMIKEIPSVKESKLCVYLKLSQTAGRSCCGLYMCICILGSLLPLCVIPQTSPSPSTFEQPHLSPNRYFPDFYMMQTPPNAPGHIRALYHA